MKKELLILCLLLSSSSFFSQSKHFFTENVDGENWYSFNAVNQQHFMTNLLNQTVFFIQPKVKINKDHATWFAANLKGVAINTQTPIIGCIALPNSFKADGSWGGNDYTNTGAVVFKLPSCSSFKLLCSSETNYAFIGIYISPDGVNYKTIKESLAAKADDGVKVGQFTLAPTEVNSTSPVYIKIANASGTRVLIHKAQIIL